MKTDHFRKFVTVLGFILGLYIVAVILQPIFFANRFGAFSNIAGTDVSYQTAEGAKNKLNKVFTDYSTGKIVIGGDIVVAGDFISQGNMQKTIDEALLTEQRGYFTFAKLTKIRHKLNLTFNDEAISKLLLSAFDKNSVVPVDASVEINSQTRVTPETIGQHLLLVESRARVISGLSDMAGNIEYKIVSQAPVLTAREVQDALTSAKVAVEEPVTLLGDGTKYEITPVDLRSWLKISSAKPKTLVAIENFVPYASEYYYLDTNKVFLYVDSLAKTIDKAAVNVRLTTTGGVVSVATKEIIGQIVDRKNAITQIQQAVVGDRTATLKIATVKPEIRSDNLAELGLTELVSTGWSDFSGSPANRIHNVRTGASKFDGVIMKPDENFSFNTALGPVEASTGYLPELVILADKTVPEFGGGLCQVSSTAFRAALNAGLPILERHAHAYPVSYYTPYGVDATIYLPTPDLRWQNDTGKYILIQTRIEGKKLFFDFYGTKKPVTIKFSGNENATGAVANVEKVTPFLYDQGVRGKNSFTAVFYRHIYNTAGKLTDNDKFTSKYDSPDKYPH